MDLDLRGKVVVITGAAQGQGRAAALAFAKEGASIIGIDVGTRLAYPRYEMGTSDQLNSLAAACEEFGVQCKVYTADVRDSAAIERSIQTALKTFKKIDVLFNNAGICAYAKVDEMAESEWDAMIDINLKGAWILARYVVPVMKAQRSGVIINNSSIAGMRGMNRLCHYAASKWGMIGLTKSWAVELAPFGIRVVSIHPTGVNTPMNDGLAALEGKTPLEVAEASAGNLLPVPWIEPEDVAASVLFLASDKSRYVTGSQHVIDAGLLTR